MKNWIKIIASGALMLTASSTMAGIIFVPIGSQYISPGTAPVTIQNHGDETFLINTTGLTGEWNIRGSDLPPGYDLAPTERVVLPFEQELGLVVDLAAGTVTTSHSKAQDTVTMGQVTITTSTISGNAVCLPLNGSECGQLVLDLQIQGVVSDPNDPSVVGRMRMGVLGSLVWDQTAVGHWASMSTVARLQGAGGLIGTIISKE